MNFDDVLQFIEVEDKRLRDKYGNYPDEEKRILARTVKMTEEVGELCNEILSFCSLQRPEKLDKHSTKSLADEFADVMFTALLLAKATNIDIKSAMQEKINKINARY